ncbi:MAG: flagellar motor switch protein FliN, partial [Oscillospiraceae bacterium]|nr:flagellar motor switch protein FliN [Oscillospiraceae bacterium]
PAPPPPPAYSPAPQAPPPPMPAPPAPAPDAYAPYPPAYPQQFPQQFPQYPPPGYPPPGYPPPGYPQQYPPGYPPPQAPPPPQAMFDVRPAQFGSFDGSGPSEIGENLDILMDVPLSVSVELGKSSKHIKEILDFNIGTIVVLDKMAGELVDIVVNGKLIAKGEVVVIDDNYGARITDIVSPSKRLGPK